MIPDPDRIMKMLELLEEAGHSQGWDVEPALGYIFKAEDGYETGLFPVQPADVHENPVTGLLMFARHTAVEKLEADPPPGGDPRSYGLAALWMAMEGWGGTQKPAPGLKIADMIGSVEFKTIRVVDMGGRVYCADRIRGESPEFTMVPARTPSPHVRTNMVEGLKVLAMALAVEMPDGAVDVKALASVGKSSPASPTP